MHLPNAPPFGALRLASPSDILRIGIVAASGFRYSPVFSWERPYHEKYPDDTLASYRCEFSDAIKNPQQIVLVVVDKYDPEEAQKSEAIIPPDNGFQAPLPGAEVIVGVGCWKLEAGSPRIGHFQNETGRYPDLSRSLNRDQNPQHVERYSNLSQDSKERHFKNLSKMDMVVVHPAYWKRGHGSTLVTWGMNLANIDHINQGVIAARSGEKLYAALGYSLLEELRLAGDEEAPEGLRCATMVYSYAQDQKVA